MSNFKHTGVIHYRNGWKFKWMIENAKTSPEIYGMVEAPNGSLTKKGCGFYRTFCPKLASMFAAHYIGNETYY